MKLVLASNNPGKLREIQALLPRGFAVISQAQLDIPEAEEPHPTFVENALAKARHASRAARLPALADDSGLCVPALSLWNYGTPLENEGAPKTSAPDAVSGSR